MPPSANIDTEPDLDDNALLVPIGGQAICEDIAPTESRLGQIEVDNEIARMIALEEHTNLEKSDNHQQMTPLTGIPDQKSNVQPAKDFTTEQPDQARDQSSALIGVQSELPEAQPSVDHTQMHVDDKSHEQPSVISSDGHKGAWLKTGSRQQTTSILGKKGSKGAFKSQLYGLRRNHPKDRAYKCQVCGISKRSMESLNDHHRRNHNPQM